MAWLNYPLRRMMVAAALLALCVVEASFVTAASTADYSDAQQANTLKFLQGFVKLNPFLASNWTGTDFCSWWYVGCVPFFEMLDFGDSGSPRFTGSLVLPDVGDDVDGSLVIFGTIFVNDMGANVAGTLPASWGRLTQLSALSLRGNALTGTLPAEWGGMEWMMYLYLDNNKFSGSIPAEWGSMADLFTVDLSGNSLCGCLPEAWKSTPTLKLKVNTAVTASNCSTTNVCPADSTTTTSAAPLTDAQKNTLKFLQGFVKLNPFLASNWTGTDFCSWWYVGCVPSFEVLDFGDSRAPKFTGSLVLPDVGDDVDGSLVIFGTIFVNDMGANVAGTLPASWGRLTQLSALSLRGNALTGTLPAEWGGMEWMMYLYLDNNKFSGSIPAEWGSMADLFTVDLSGNSLCGCLPEAWKSTPTLKLKVNTAVTASNCSITNVCAADSTTTTTSTPTSTTTSTTSAPAPRQKKSGRKLIPLWCVLGAVGGVLVGVAVGVGVYFYRRRQRKEADVKRLQAFERKEEEPFAQTPDTPY